jgi:hypothetical protein
VDRAAPTNGGDDAWTVVRIDGDQVVAYSWSCYMVSIDLAKAWSGPARSPNSNTLIGREVPGHAE